MKNSFEFDSKAAGFDEPTQLPRDEAERRQWQAANKAWWESTPMRYDWREGLSEVPGTDVYFKEIDRRFLSSARKYMPWRNIPFEAVIPFNELHDKDVLEIGVGQGTHAQLLASHCRSFTGIDLTSYATEMTSRRLKLFSIQGEVRQMDAENMDFTDNSFDFIWSWGVIHHSADTCRVLKEMRRVLRRGGRCSVMIYYKSWWSFYTCGFLRGVFQRRFMKHPSVHHVVQSATDGAIARHYTQRGWRRMTGDLFDVQSMQIYGLKSDIVPLPYGRLKKLFEDLVPDALARFLTCRLRCGAFLVAHMRKS